MAFDYNHIKNRKFEPLKHKYTIKDTILYALGVGLGADALDEKQLRFVYEENLQALPTMAVVLSYPGFWMKEPDTGIDWVKVLHGEQRLRIHKPLPAEGFMVGETRVSRIIDKGANKGSLVVSEREIRDADTNELYATIEQVNFCRGDGGLSQSDEPIEALPAVPKRTADKRCTLTSLEQAALIYRLSGDFNPLHADPKVAQSAGFKRPILHGLATYGMACNALLQTCVDYAAERLARLDCRFSAPVYPGEALEFEIWELEQPNHYAFQARAVDRDIVVLSHGVAEFTVANA